MRNCYYVSEKEYIVNQLERNGIKTDKIDISDYSRVCETAEYVANLLDGKGLLYSSCSEIMGDCIKGNKKPFVFFTLRDVKYYFLSFDAVVQAVSEYMAFGRKFAFITMISGKFTEEFHNGYINRVSKKYFGRIYFRPSEIHVLGKVSFDENRFYIQPIIIY